MKAADLTPAFHTRIPIIEPCRIMPD